MNAKDELHINSLAYADMAGRLHAQAAALREYLIRAKTGLPDDFWSMPMIDDILEITEYFDYESFSEAFNRILSDVKAIHCYDDDWEEEDNDIVNTKPSGAEK